MINIVNRLTAKLSNWAFETYGSSRSSAIIRIGLVILIWTRWANELILTRDISKAYPLLSISFFFASSLMLLGYETKISTASTSLVLLSMYYYFGHFLNIEPWTHHHAYLLAFATFLSTFTPSGKSYSLDRWLAIREAEKKNLPIPREEGNLWGLRLIAAQLSIIYFWTAFNKLITEFVNGARLEQIFMWFYFGSDYPSIIGFHEIMVALSIVTIITEFSLGFGMLFRRTRKILVIPGLLLHAIFYVLLPVRTYSATMWLLYLAYFDADKIHAFVDEMQGYSSSPN